jgi:aryl-alcohol dehydrogenase-like predicted oxidoreductase
MGEKALMAQDDIVRCTGISELMENTIRLASNVTELQETQIELVQNPGNLLEQVIKLVKQLLETVKEIDGEQVEMIQFSFNNLRMSKYLT